MTFSQWAPKRKVEENYQVELSRLIDGFDKKIRRLELISPFDIIDRLQAYCDTEFFRGFAEASAYRMVTGLQVGQMQTWKEAARASMQGRVIYQALQNELQGSVGIAMRNIVKENARLISSLPSSLRKEANNFISRESLAGRRAEDIAKDLKAQFPKVAKARVLLIARTETSKASTALTRARSEDLGLAWYIWRTSEDARVRSAHRHMDKVLVNWNNAPSPEALDHEKSYGHYHAGDTFNCRCYPAPIVNINMVRWPAKVYYGGQIRYMTRARFEQISGASKRFGFAA